MATNKGKAPKPTRDSDNRKLDKNAKQPNSDDRILGLGKLIGRKPPRQGS